MSNLNRPPVALACPECKTVLVPGGPDEMVCPQEGHRYTKQDGVWRCLPPERAARYEAFLKDYEAIRSAEGRGATRPEYYRALPFTDLSGKRSAEWQLRARSYRIFVERILTPIERKRGEALKILDLGAGNAWLSSRMRRRGHLPVAVDLRTGSLDGLGAICQYDLPLNAVQADYDCLPCPQASFDLVVYNAGSYVPGTVLQTDVASFERAWRVGCLGGFLVGREAARRAPAARRHPGVPQRTRNARRQPSDLPSARTKPPAAVLSQSAPPGLSMMSATARITLERRFALRCGDEIVRMKRSHSSR